jgi:hypothetical protein
MFSCGIHQVCLFHHQQSVLRFLKERFDTKEEINKPKKKMKKVFHWKSWKKKQKTYQLPLGLCKLKITLKTYFLQLEADAFQK